MSERRGGWRAVAAALGAAATTAVASFALMKLRWGTPDQISVVLYLLTPTAATLAWRAWAGGGWMLAGGLSCILSGFVAGAVSVPEEGDEPIFSDQGVSFLVFVATGIVLVVAVGLVSVTAWLRRKTSSHG